MDRAADGALGAGSHSPATWRPRVLQALQTTFGFNALRGQQEDAIMAALLGQDVLVLMPTGAGKSLCYSLPALLKPGIVLVVSPLIALMQDQVEGLRRRGVAAEYLSSTRSEAERRTILADLQQPAHLIGLSLLFITPELVATAGFAAVAEKLRTNGAVSLLAVDEAHCISSWGHDFRPAYRKLATLRRQLPGVPLMALTATAAPKVQEDIVVQLRLQDPLRLVSSMNRPNIQYSVYYTDLLKNQDPVPEIFKLLRDSQRDSGSGEAASSIIYTLKRESADEVAARLRSGGVVCAAYHAGLPAKERAQVLSDWAGGRTPVVAATVAFGMGIDRACVRLVVHVDMPKTLEAFYQESGRAGRDGLPARSVLFYSRDDRDRMDWILRKEQARRQKKGSQLSRGTDARLVVAAFGEVVNYATAETCRRRALLKHFGETLPAAHCTGCDYCEEPDTVAAQLAELGRLTIELAAGRGGGFAGWMLPAARAGAGRLLCGSADEESGMEAASDAASDAVSDSSDKEIAEARAIASRARAAAGISDEAVMDALQRAEQKAEAAGVGRTDLKRKLGAAAGGGPQPAGPRQPPPAARADEAAREASRVHLRAAIAKNVGLALHGRALEAAAQICEKHCYGAGGSRQIYRGKLANAVRAIGMASQRSALPCDASELRRALLAAQEGDDGEPSGPPSIQQLPFAPSIGHTDVRAADLLQRFNAAALSVDAAEGTEATPEGSEAAYEEAVVRLLLLRETEVTAALLAETGIGLKVKAMSRSSNARIKASAKSIIAHWKSQIVSQMNLK